MLSIAELLARPPCTAKDAETKAKCKLQGANIQDAKRRRTQTDTAPGEELSANARLGLCGIGDERYPIHHDLFRDCSQCHGFTHKLAQDWKEKQGEPVAGDAVEPKDASHQRNHCEDFCSTNGMVGVNPVLFNAAKRLLFDINRMMKDMYKSIKKEIGRDARHPVLFVRWVSPSGRATNVLAWVITFVCFKPYRLDAIKLLLPEERPFSFPFAADLATTAVYKSDKLMFCFESTSTMAAEFAKLNPSQKADAGTLEYTFNPSYRLDWKQGLMTLIFDKPFNWVGLGGCLDKSPGPDVEGTEDHGEDEWQDDEEEAMQELDEITSMLADLVGDPQVTQTQPQKSAKKSPEQTAGASFMTRTIDMNHMNFEYLHKHGASSSHIQV